MLRMFGDLVISIDLFSLNLQDMIQGSLKNMFCFLNWLLRLLRVVELLR